MPTFRCDLSKKPIGLSGRPTMNDSEYIECDHIFKLLIVGDSGVGKSCMLRCRLPAALYARL